MTCALSYVSSEVSEVPEAEMYFHFHAPSRSLLAHCPGE